MRPAPYGDGWVAPAEVLDAHVPGITERHKRVVDQKNRVIEARDSQISRLKAELADMTGQRDRLRECLDGMAPLFGCTPAPSDVSAA